MEDHPARPILRAYRHCPYIRASSLVDIRIRNRNCLAWRTDSIWFSIFFDLAYLIQVTATLAAVSDIVFRLAADARHTQRLILLFHLYPQPSTSGKGNRLWANPFRGQKYIILLARPSVCIPNRSTKQHHNYLHPLQYNSNPTTATSITMRRTSATLDIPLPITYTPTTHRISKAKKGKRVHACQYPGCEKVFTRAEHRRYTSFSTVVQLSMAY